MTPSLARRLGLTALIIYGIGDILGAGIYALVGKVIGLAGPGAWLTFVLAALVALVTGISYAELTSRYPVSAGAAAFVRRAFPGRFAATVVGILVVGSGLASAATVAVAFSDYLAQLIPSPPWVAQLILVSAVSFLSFWGIQESSRVNMLLTFLEFSGLLLVILAGAWLLTGDSWNHFLQLNRTELQLSPIVGGITIAFFAYIGFEDLANLAEECKNPSRDLPRAILIAISFSIVIYLLVTLALLINLPQELITQSKTPLLLVFEKAGLEWVSDYFPLIALVAITNTGLINMIMVSRLMYGMAHEGLLPRVIGAVHEGRRTPWVGILIAFTASVFLIFTGSLKILAQTTSLLIIVVFFLVHLSLIKVKGGKHPHEGIKFPMVFPISGVLLCLVLMTQYPLGVYLRSTILLGIALIIWAVQIRKKQRSIG
jgi:amino acid transporter